MAIVDGKLAGHILFSEVVIETGSGSVSAASLAPMAVRPEFQRRGIRSALVRQGLEICRDSSYSIAIVVGHTGYHPRFGFSPEKAGPLRSPFAGPGVLEGIAGTAIYPPAFSIFD